MKFTPIAMLLGCSALVCTVAVRSNLIHLEPPALVGLPEIHKTLQHLGFGMPSFFNQPAPVPVADTGAPESGPLAPPLLSKDEALLLIAESARKHNVPAAFVQSIVAAESNFNSAALSAKGAMGLMQLMPATARDLGADPAVPSQNVDAGTRYLRQLMDRYLTRRGSIKHVIAAYNAGPGMVDRYRGIPPFRETRTYVTRVLGFLKQFQGAQKRGAIGG
jgi:soluble lytic murein transglycosylase-like protein